jgi:hypothetical protein
MAALYKCRIFCEGVLHPSRCHNGFFIGSLHSPRKWEPRFREVENLLHAPMKILQNIEKWRCFVGKPAWSVASGAIITLVSVAANPTHRDKVGTATL